MTSCRMHTMVIKTIMLISGVRISNKYKKKDGSMMKPKKNLPDLPRRKNAAAKR